MERLQGKPEIAYCLYQWLKLVTDLLFALRRTALYPHYFLKDGKKYFWHRHFASLPKCGADIVLPKHHLRLACAVEEAALRCT